MKSLQLFSLFFAAFLIVSCNKEIAKDSSNTSTRIASAGSIVGAWELRILYGVQVPGISPYFSPGNGNIRKFDDSTYQYFEKGKLSSAGNYMLTKDTSQATGRLMDAIILVQEHKRKVHFEIVKDTLTLYDGTIAACGTIQKYVRIESHK